MHRRRETGIWAATGLPAGGRQLWTNSCPLFLNQVLRLVHRHVARQVRAQRLGQRRLPGPVRPGDPDPHLRLPLLWRLPRRFYGYRGTRERRT